MLGMEQLGELLETSRAAAKAHVREFSIGGSHFAFNSQPAIMGVINLAALISLRGRMSECKFGFA
jgi:hypothetical protein